MKNEYRDWDKNNIKVEREITKQKEIGCFIFNDSSEKNLEPTGEKMNQETKK